MPQSSPLSVAKPLFTQRDLHLAALIYPILIGLAKSFDCMTYKQLVDTLQKLHPEDAVVASMRPIHSGRILGVIYQFAEQKKLPRISSLIISRKGECGKGLSKRHDCNAERARCFDFDWNEKLPEFWDFIETNKQQIKLPKTVSKITLAQATSIRWDFFSQNKSRLKPDVRRFSQVILDTLMKGVEPELAFAPFMLINKSENLTA